MNLVLDLDQGGLAGFGSKRVSDFLESPVARKWPARRKDST
jgi:hypothetical protein